MAPFPPRKEHYLLCYCAVESPAMLAVSNCFALFRSLLPHLFLFLLLATAITKRLVRSVF